MALLTTPLQDGRNILREGHGIGEMSHAAIRDRVDEWVTSLGIASEFVEPPPIAGGRIM